MSDLKITDGDDTDSFQLDAALAREAALREELASVTADRDQLKGIASAYIASDGAKDLRIAAAEQRNVDVEKRAADLIECLWGIELPGAGNPRLRKLRRALEALKPTESGASDEHPLRP